MTKRIYWKKGMKLTDEIMKSSDECNLESLNHAFVLATNGRFGLIPSKRGFDVSVSINKNIIDVESLTCLGLTKSGAIIDINYDTTFTNNFDTRIILPSNEGDCYIICVEVLDTWKETYDNYCEPEYKFTLASENSVIKDNMLPFARIINDHGWRIDEMDFVPPCLYVLSHTKYKDLAIEFGHILKTSSQNLSDCINSDCKTAVNVFWPIVEQLRISMDKDIELLTPMALLGNIQKYICGFLCACTLDEGLNLMEADIFRNFINIPYDYKDVNIRIKEGLKLCYVVCEKIERIKEFKPAVEKIEAPTISNSNLIKKCTNSKVRIPVENNAPGSTIYYTIDGSEPTNSSNSGTPIVFASGFIGGRGKEEEDKIVVIKVKAMFNGICSSTNTYKVRLQKDVKHWIEI